MMISIKNQYGVVELVTLQEFIAMQAAELEKLMNMAKADSVK